MWGWGPHHREAKRIRQRRERERAPGAQLRKARQHRSGPRVALPVLWARGRWSVLWPTRGPCSFITILIRLWRSTCTICSVLLLPRSRIYPRCTVSVLGTTRTFAPAFSHFLHGCICTRLLPCVSFRISYIDNCVLHRSQNNYPSYILFD